MFCVLLDKEFEIDTFKKIIDLNLNSVMASCSFFHENLVRNKGSIVIIGSGASYHAVKGNPAYSASKGGLLTLIKTLAEAWAINGIRVNGNAPGYVASKLTEVSFGNEKRYENSLCKPCWVKKNNEHYCSDESIG